MEHKLHVRKVILARAKLTPLSDEELARKVRPRPLLITSGASAMCVLTCFLC